MERERRDIKRILFYLHRYPAFGGIENITTALAEAFADMPGYKVGIFSCVEEDNAASMATSVDFVTVASRSDMPIDHQLDECVSRFRPDVVIFQDSYAEIEDALICAKDRYGFRLITVEHNTPDSHLLEYRQRWKSHSWLTPKGFAKKLMYPYVYGKISGIEGKRHKKLLKATDAYVVLSESYIPLLHRLWNIKDDKIIAIPNFRDAGIPDACANVSDRKRQALFVGRLTQQKGIGYLIEVWSAIERCLPDWKLVVAGDGEQRQLLEGEIARRGLRQIELLGFRDNMTELYRESAALLMTSIYEGFPLTLVESQQCGTIPFAFNSFHSLGDVIDSDTGFSIKPFDVKEYAERFVTFARKVEADPQYHAAFSRRCVEKGSQFGRDNVLSKWTELIDKLTER